MSPNHLNHPNRPFYTGNDPYPTGKMQTTAFTGQPGSPYPGVGNPYAGYGNPVPPQGELLPMPYQGNLPTATKPASSFSFSDIKGMIERFGGIDGILGTMTKVQKVVKTFQQMSPLLRLFVKSFGKRKGAPQRQYRYNNRRKRRSGGSTKKNMYGRKAYGRTTKKRMNQGIARKRTGNKAMKAANHFSRPRPHSHSHTRK